MGERTLNLGVFATAEEAATAYAAYVATCHEHGEMAMLEEEDADWVDALLNLETVSELESEPQTWCGKRCRAAANQACKV